MSTVADSPASSLCVAPVVRLLLVVEVADTGDERPMSLTLSPVDRLALSSLGDEDVIGMIFDDVVGYRTAFRTTFRAGFDVDVSHIISPIVAGASHTHTLIAIA